MKTLKVDKRGRVRFGVYNFRFEIDSTDPTEVKVYQRETDPLGETEVLIGRVNLRTAAFRLSNGTTGDNTVQPRRRTFGFETAVVD